MVRLHLRLRLTIILFFAFSFVLLWFVKSDTCRSYLTTWAGMLPLQASPAAVLHYTCLDDCNVIVLLPVMTQQTQPVRFLGFSTGQLFLKAQLLCYISILFL